MKQVYHYYRLLTFYACMSVNEITKLTMSVLAFR